ARPSGLGLQLRSAGRQGLCRLSRGKRMSQATTLGDMIERNAALHADKPAVIYQNRPTTYRAFRDRAHALAANLHARGLRRQDRAAILAMNSLAYLEFYAACE